MKRTPKAQFKGPMSDLDFDCGDGFIYHYDESPFVVAAIVAGLILLICLSVLLTWWMHRL